nr:MAG TPA: hypothetical protein [Caudoviricetes sp.]
MRIAPLPRQRRAIADAQKARVCSQVAEGNENIARWCAVFRRNRRAADAYCAIAAIAARNSRCHRKRALWNDATAAVVRAVWGACANAD